MYFIVFLKLKKIHVVVPCWWIKDCETTWEKFINRGLNSFQQYLCFYSEKSPAFLDGRPNVNFEPQFNGASRGFSVDDYHLCHIVRFSSK